jgi:hypothetical protein
LPREKKKATLEQWFRVWLAVILANWKAEIGGSQFKKKLAKP